MLEQLIPNSVDIGPHLHTIRDYASMCDSIVEFGVRDGHSTFALGAGLAERARNIEVGSSWPSLNSYDINPFPGAASFRKMAFEEHVTFSFHQNDDRKVVIENVHLLLLDTYHEYAQLDAELSLHAKHAMKWIILHDTYLPNDDNGHSKDMWVAIFKLLSGAYLNSGKWIVIDDFRNCMGLTILQRQQ